MSRPKTLLATIPGMISEADLGPLREISDVDVFEADKISENALAKKCAGIDVLMLNYDIVKKLTEKFYQNKNVQTLKAISTDITGMDWANPEIASRHGVVLQNVPHYSTESVAETIMCEVLLHSRQRMGSFYDAINRKEVEGRKGFNLQDKTAGVIGLGSIGRRVAELFTCFGMNVVIWNRTPKSDYESVSLEELFERSKVIALCLATEVSGPSKTVGIIGRKLLDKSNNAILINLAGEHLIVLDDIVQALKSGTISGYSVERSQEMLASPLSKMPNVHLPPKNAWKSDESLEMLRNIWVSNTVSAVLGKPENIFA